MNPTDNLRVMTAIRQDGRNMTLLTMCFQLLTDNKKFDLKKAARDAARDFVNNTKEGYETWDDNGMNFDWWNFWNNVPNNICEAHGFQKIKITEEDDVNWDETLVDEDDLEVSDEQRDALLDYLCTDTEKRDDFLAEMSIEYEFEDDDPAKCRASLEQMLDEDIMPYEQLQYYWRNVAQD